MEGKYHILGITTEGKRNYWTGSGWSEVLTDSKIFTDLDDARDEWWKVTGNGKKLPEGFRRIIVPNYSEPEVAKESSSTDKITLNKKQKEFLWDALDMSEVYANEDSIWSDLSTCIDKTWELVPNNDSEYPWTLRMPGHGDWDSISQDLADKVKNLDKEYELVQMPGTQGNWGEKHWGAKESVGGEKEPATEIAMRNPEVSSAFDIKSLVEDFQKYLSNQRRHDDVWYSDKSDSFTVDVDGDWKHDHLYMDMLVEEFLNDRGLTLADVQSRTIEEDGSDWYRAERTYRIKVPKTGELTAGQIAKKLNQGSIDKNKKAEESIRGQASSNFSRKSVYESIIGRR